MRKITLSLILSILLSACSFGNDTPEPARINDYLWQASVSKLSFMPAEHKDPAKGILITDWAKMRSSSKEAFKVSVKITPGELRADALKVTVLKKQLGHKEEADPAMAAEIEREILAEAKRIFNNNMEKIK